jgi:hypothetical protein
MPVTVELPPGCKGLDCKDGTRYTAAQPGGHIRVDDRHAEAITQGQYGEHGLMDARGRTFLGTKAGRECSACRRVWQVWSFVCPKCGGETIEWTR